MITEPTVFIIGAGGSKPYGFPTGKELRELICKNYLEKFSALIQNEAEDDFTTKTQIDIAKKFVDAFYNSNNESIDLFLSKNLGFSDSGTRSITIEILDAERRFAEEGMKFRSNDWYGYLFNRMTEDLVRNEGYKQILDNKVSFITFNYDRSLENIFSKSIRNSYLSNATETLQYLSKIPIHHVHGQTGFLSWQKSSKHIKFGQAYHLDLIDQIRQDIKIIYDFERSIDNEISTLIREAKRIFFLGFGYSPENLKLLKIPDILVPGQKVYGTALGLLPEEIIIVKHRLNGEYVSDFDRDMIIENSDCLTLLRKYLLKIE